MWSWSSAKSRLIRFIAVGIGGQIVCLSFYLVLKFISKNGQLEMLVVGRLFDDGAVEYDLCLAFRVLVQGDRVVDELFELLTAHASIGQPEMASLVAEVEEMLVQGIDVSDSKSLVQAEIDIVDLVFGVVQVKVAGLNHLHNLGSEPTTDSLVSSSYQLTLNKVGGALFEELLFAIVVVHGFAEIVVAIGELESAALKAADDYSVE